MRRKAMLEINLGGFYAFFPPLTRPQALQLLHSPFLLPLALPLPPLSVAFCLSLILFERF